MAKKTTITKTGNKKARRKPAGQSPAPNSATSGATGAESASSAPRRTSATSESAAKTATPRKKTRSKKAAGVAARRGRKSSAAAKTLRTDAQVPKRPRKPRKTHLKPEDLEEFRYMLIAKRRELVGDVTNLESEAMRQSSSGGRGTSAMPIHMADLGSDTWEQELTLGLIENERGLLREIDEALDRIEEKTYGICLATGKPITKSRLRAKPEAKYCIEYARKRELGLA